MSLRNAGNDDIVTEKGDPELARPKPYAHLNLQRKLCGERQRNERQRAKRPDRLTYALINMLDLRSARFVIIKTYKS
jgi:hypothetical protein